MKKRVPHLWWKGATVGFIIGIILVSGVLSIYPSVREGYDACRQESSNKHCNLITTTYNAINPIRYFYVEFYLTLPHYFFGLGIVSERFGADSIITKTLLYFFYGLPTAIIGALIWRKNQKR